MHRLELRQAESGRQGNICDMCDTSTISRLSNLTILGRHDARPSFADLKIYVVQTTTKVIERCLLMTTDPGDLVLDPTCGSGTTAYVAEQWGRRWITIDTSRVALALARTRLMAAKYPVLPPGRLARWDQKGSRAHGPKTAASRNRKRRPQGIRLQARSPCHAEIDRQQSRHQGRA